MSFTRTHRVMALEPEVSPERPAACAICLPTRLRTWPLSTSGGILLPAIDESEQVNFALEKTPGCVTPRLTRSQKMALFGTFSSGSSSGFLGIVVAAATRKAPRTPSPAKSALFATSPYHVAISGWAPE